MPEGRAEFAKISVGSNSFDHRELAEYPRPNIPGRMNSTLHGKVFPVPGVLSKCHSGMTEGHRHV